MDKKRKDSVIRATVDRAALLRGVLMLTALALLLCFGLKPSRAAAPDAEDGALTASDASARLERRVRAAPARHLFPLRARNDAPPAPASRTGRHDEGRTRREVRPVGHHVVFARAGEHGNARLPSTARSMLC